MFGVSFVSGFILHCQAMISKTPDYAIRLKALRQKMVDAGVDALIVPHADTFLGEYVPPSGARLKWLTGFTGSAGVAVILKDRAVVMSDGRYTIQLKQEIDAALFQTADSTKIKISDWLCAQGAQGVQVGYDPALHTPAEIEGWEKAGLMLMPLASNPIDAIWLERPALPQTPVELFPDVFAGRTSQEKRKEIAAAVKESGATHFLITQPDSLAWLLNVRAHDMAHIPVPLTRALIDADGSVQWFIDASRVSADIRAALGNAVSLMPPDRMMDELRAMAAGGRRIGLDVRHTPVSFVQTVQKAGGNVVTVKDPCTQSKAVKTDAEQNAMRAAHKRDGAAMVRFLCWLDGAVEKGEALSEISVQKVLESFRREAPEYRGASFGTICGFGANGAIVHYHSDESKNVPLTRGQLLLLDSGAQYADGTTDITRTLAIGTPTEEMRERFTLVLKGHIAVANAKFPQGTTGAQIDALARAPLWAQGLDYAHGTGHGVGCYLAVHEESASISPRGVEAVLPGMIISNEPGYYKEGAYGIRIESLVLTQTVGTCPDTGKPLLGFETITLCPIDRRLIVPEMLTGAERDWLNAYHARVRDVLSPAITPAEREWLKSATAPI